MGRLLYQIPMRWRAAHRFVRHTAIGLMLLAALAFVQQGALIKESEAMAWAGILAAPAVELDGSWHVHDSLARHVHMHGGNNGAGHVHKAADHQHDEDVDGTAPTMFWTLGSAPAVMPVTPACVVSFAVANAIGAPRQGCPDGFEPDGLSRPPSTPSIA